jgi:hypothetical protein
MPCRNGADIDVVNPLEFVGDVVRSARKVNALAETQRLT